MWIQKKFLVKIYCVVVNENGIYLFTPSRILGYYTRHQFYLLIGILEMYLGYLKLYFIMKFTEIFLGETVNPQTGEIVTKVWCKTDTGLQLAVANKIEEIQALGNSAAVLARLIIVPGTEQYKTFARLSNVVKSSKSLFAPVEDNDDDNDDEDKVAAGNEMAPKKAKK